MLDLNKYKLQNNLSQYQFPTEAPVQVKQTFLDRLNNSILGKVGQAGQTISNSIAKSVAGPFVKVVGSGIREAQSIPALAKGDVKKSQEVASQPLFGQKTLQGSTPLENVGTALEIGSYAVGGGTLKNIAGNQIKKATLEGGLQGILAGAGSYLGNTEDPTLKGTLKSAAIGGASGAAIGGGLSYLSGKLSPSALKARAAANAQKASKEVDTLAGKIVQGKEADIAKAKSALSKIDVTHVKTYQDLAGALDEKITSVSDKLDQTLLTNPEAKPLSELVLKSKAGSQTITHNYVDDALNQMEDFYRATNDAEGQALIAQVRNKAATEGLTVKEINDIAKEHGNILNAYNANGQAASGLSKQAAENTRMGVKATGRSLFGNEVYKQADEELANLIRTRDLAENMAEEVNKLQQKVQERGLGERVGRFVGKAINTLGLGSPKGLVESFLSRGTGLKTLNALDLEQALSKNLNTLQKALSSGGSEESIIAQLQAIIDNPPKYTPKGKVIESTIEPQKLQSFKPNKNKLVKVTDYSNPDYPSYITPDRIKKGVSAVISKENAGKAIDVKGGTGNTLKGGSSLIQEAKKYKSAEEFVSKQPTLYHQTTAKFNKFNLKKSADGSAWFTDSKQAIDKSNVGASLRPGEKSYVVERYIKPNIKLADQTLSDKLTTDQLIQEGYRGVKFVSKDPDYGNYHRLFFPNEDLISKSQLTDIWKKANKK